MNDTMFAAVLPESGSWLVIERVRVPRPRQGEVLVQVAACGVCHTDLHVIKGEVAFPTPAVLGHEISGTVVELGEGVDAPAVGTRVVGTFIMPCGTCGQCRVGRDDLCERFFSMNRLEGTLYDGETRLFREDGSPLAMYSMGGLAEYAVVPVTGVYPLPDVVPFEEAAVIGCAGMTAFGAVRNAAECGRRASGGRRDRGHRLADRADRPRARRGPGGGRRRRRREARGREEARRHGRRRCIQGIRSTQSTS